MKNFIFVSFICWILLTLISSTCLAADFYKIKNELDCKIYQAESVFDLLVTSVWLIGIFGFITASCQFPVKTQWAKTSLKTITVILGLLVGLLTLFCSKATDVGYKDLRTRIDEVQGAILILKMKADDDEKVTKEEVAALSEYANSKLPKIYIPQFILTRLIPEACAQEPPGKEYSTQEQQEVNEYFSDYFKNRDVDVERLKKINEEKQRQMELLQKLNQRQTSEPEQPPN
jgi:hypothetical protein